MQIPLGQFVCKPSGAMVIAHIQERCLFLFQTYYTIQGDITSLLIIIQRRGLKRWFYFIFMHKVTDYSPLVFRVVKLSSPYLNVLIISGVILYYIDVILFGIDANKASRCTVNVLCMVRGAKKSTLLCLCMF